MLYRHKYNQAPTAKTANIGKYAKITASDYYSAKKGSVVQIIGIEGRSYKVCTADGAIDGICPEDMKITAKPEGAINWL